MGLNANSLREFKDLAPGDHLFCLYGTEEDRRALLVPFVRHGLERGEKVLYVDAQTAEAVFRYMREDGLEPRTFIDSGQLAIFGPERPSRADGTFNPDAMIALIAQETESALARGFTALRVIGEMTWTLRGSVTSKMLIEFESKATALLSETKCTGLCLYDRRQFAPCILLDALAAHPAATAGVSVHDNIFRLPPREFLGAILLGLTSRERVRKREQREKLEKNLRKTQKDLEERLEEQAAALAKTMQDLQVEIAERKAVERKLRDALAQAQRRGEEVASLLEGARAVLGNQEFEDTARAIFHSCRNLVGANAGHIALLNTDGTEDDLVFLDPGDHKGEVDPSPPGSIRGLRAEACRAGKAVSHNDFGQNDQRECLPAGPAALENVLFAPLVIAEKTVGLIELANKPGGFSEDDARLASAFGELAAIALHNSRTLESLENSEARFRSVAQTARDAIVSVDARGTIAFWNHGAEIMFGYSADEVTNQSLTLIIPQRFRAAHEKRMRRAISQEHPHLTGKTRELIGLRKDGSEFPLELSLATWKTREGRFFSSVIRDISERKRMEEELVRAQRLEAAGRIAGQVAHDFNNLLGPLMGFPELIKMLLPLDHPAIKYCDAMLEVAPQMVEISGDLLTLSRRGHFNQEPLDLNYLVKQAVDQMPKGPDSLVVDLDLARDLLNVKGSSAQLLRIISNLLSNAREAMRDVGTLAVSTENVYMDKPFGRYNRVEVGEYVRLEVRDTGCGVSPEINDKIFDAFFTTKTSGKRRGSGLGLSIVQTIVADHGGYVDVESEVGKGTIFSIYLPVCREELKEAQREELKGGSEAILVVDDDEVQREVVGQLLKTLGYRVSVASSGEEAVSCLRENTADLLIMDMTMPEGIDGAETYWRAQKVRPGVKAIILSGFAESEQVRRAQALGAGAYVRKPVTLDGLARAVRQELDQRGDLARQPGHAID